MTLISWQAGSLVFFLYLAVTAMARPRVPSSRRMRTIAWVGGALAVLALSYALPAQHLLNTWLLPPALLLIGYWTSGQLFVAPMPALEARLLGFDRALGIDRLSARMPSLLVEVLEFAYTAVYPLIGVALALALREGITADRFWTLVLVTDYICFAMLPWFQTRPPRSAGVPPPWHSRWRGINLSVLDASSVQVNTFPSGHAAEAFMAFLILSSASWPIAMAMLISAVLVTAATVFGRYHYAADAVAGWAVALVVFALV